MLVLVVSLLKHIIKYRIHLLTLKENNKLLHSNNRQSFNLLYLKIFISIEILVWHFFCLRMILSNLHCTFKSELLKFKTLWTFLPTKLFTVVLNNLRLNSNDYKTKLRSYWLKVYILWVINWNIIYFSCV